jgi:hypothetical protein
VSEWVRTPAYQALWLGLAAIFAVLALGDLSDGGDWDPYAAAWLAGSIVVGTRAPLLGVKVSDGAAVVRNFYSTRQIAAADVARVEVVNYDGLLIPLGSWYWATVRLTTHAGREVVAYGLVGRRAVARRRASRL